jgi:hypothetical protein
LLLMMEFILNMKKLLSLLFAFTLITFNSFAGTLEMDWFEGCDTDAHAQTEYVTDGAGIAATGGTITTDGNYRIHTFTTNGTFTPTAVGNVEVLVVAGGGSGGLGRGGGGGAGGIVYDASFAVTAQAYNITVGGGGAAQTVMDTSGNAGSNSVFSTLTATGGGLGSVGAVGGNGGCGGGAGGEAGVQSGGTGSQGYDGEASTDAKGGGGGGMGEVGGTDGSQEGGDGVAYSISGSSVYYGGGGGGAADLSHGEGGLGGGGAGATGTAGGGSGIGVAGTANTGGGGGGGAYNGSNSGAGGSGIVIIRYLVPLQSYSEDTDKTQGSYALRVEAATTDSLNKVLTHTFAVNSNLAGVKNLRLDAYALRTGSNWKLGIHDTGGTTTEITPVIATSNTFQPINWDLSAVADANKDNIDTCKLTVTNADSANTIILDDFKIAQAIDLFGWVN